MNSQNTNISTAPQQYCLEIKGSLELLQIIKQQLEGKMQKNKGKMQKNKGKMQKNEEKIDLSIIRRNCFSLFMNLFLKHLKSKKQTQLLEYLLAFRKDMPSKQKKFGKGHVKNLLKDKSEIQGDFKKQWLEFLSSNELKDLINKKKRINGQSKQQYIGLIDEIKEQSNSEKLFYKFMKKNLDQMHNNEKNNGINLSDDLQINDESISLQFQLYKTSEDLFENDGTNSLQFKLRKISENQFQSDESSSHQLNPIEISEAQFQSDGSSSLQFKLRKISENQFQSDESSSHQLNPIEISEAQFQSDGSSSLQNNSHNNFEDFEDNFEYQTIDHYIG